LPCEFPANSCSIAALRQGSVGSTPDTNCPKMAIGRSNIYGNSSAARAADVPLLPSLLTASFSVRGKVTWYSPCVFLGRVRAPGRRNHSRRHPQHQQPSVARASTTTAARHIAVCIAAKRGGVDDQDRMAGMGREQDLSGGARGVRSKASNGRQPQQMSAIARYCSGRGGPRKRKVI